MAAGVGVFVMRHRHELAAEHLFAGDELDLAGELQQARREQHENIFVVNPAVAVGVLSLEVGVDRHLSDAASTDGIDVVDCSSSALGADGFDSGFRNIDLHRTHNPQSALPIPT